MNRLEDQRWSVGVVIPAHDEQASITRCVTSVHRACEAARRCASAWTVVVADRCTDRTAALARACLADHGEVLECEAGGPGRARQLGVAAALRHFHAVHPARIWIANTDADTHVPPEWISTQLEHADAEAEAIAGIVELDAQFLTRELEELFARTYPIAPDGTHGHVHGANLGVRADAYLAVGGWSDVQVSEDHCLWGRLQHRGGRLLSLSASVVQTSARLRGRAEGGFADTLRQGLLDACTS